MQIIHSLLCIKLCSWSFLTFVVTISSSLISLSSQCYFLWGGCHIWSYCGYHSSNKIGECAFLKDLWSRVPSSRLCYLRVWNNCGICKSRLWVSYPTRIVQWDDRIILESTNFFALLILLKAMCRNHRQQLCFIWCTKLFTFR